MVGSPSKPKWVLGTTRSRAELHMVIHLHPKGPQNEHESRECDRMWARRSATYMDWAAPILTLTLPPSPLSPIPFACICVPQFPLPWFALTPAAALHNPQTLGRGPAVGLPAHGDHCRRPSIHV